MIDGDLFQWIVVPDDRQALPPVDEDIIYGLKDFSSLGTQTNLPIHHGYDEPSTGLLLGPDLCHNECRDVEMLGAITQYETQPDAGQNVFLPTSVSPLSYISSYASLLPPALSPDSSPTSVASSPWLRTPGTDPSLADVDNADILWDGAETEEPCSTIHFFDQAGNSLEDIPLQVQELMPEDIACSPQLVSNASLPRVLDATLCGRLGSVTPTPLFDTPTFVISPPCGLASPTEVVPLGPAHYTSFPPPSPPTSQSLFAFSPVTYHPRETPLPEYSASSSLSPLSTLSCFSQSPSASPNPSPLIRYSSLSPANSPLPLSSSDEGVEVTDASSMFATVTSAKLRGKRRAGTLNDDAPPWKIRRRSKAKNVDEEEWNPVSLRVKRPRAVVSSESTRQTGTSSSSCPPDESLSYETEGSEEYSDAAHTNCEICGQGFTRTSDYIRHIENSSSHPETRKVWPCPHCESTLGRKDALARHIRTMHPGQPVVISEGIPGSQLRGGQKEPFVQRMRQRKMLPRRQPKDRRRYR
ncbi:hypothetical protein J3R82DRAFT_1824 [Butyriboletus roseoflavus]|nr:hypothetical protein J3R82DRAFT_1824 [Butyriboletus roseoflavus]